MFGFPATCDTPTCADDFRGNDLAVGQVCAVRLCVCVSGGCIGWIWMLRDWMPAKGALRFVPSCLLPLSPGGCSCPAYDDDELEKEVQSAAQASQKVKAW